MRTADNRHPSCYTPPKIGVSSSAKLVPWWHLRCVPQLPSSESSGDAIAQLVDGGANPRRSAGRSRERTVLVLAVRSERTTSPVENRRDGRGWTTRSIRAVDSHPDRFRPTRSSDTAQQ